ncbi:MAG: hypothetical protein JO187_10695, partial [Acidobacteria bacterium]|nr:hypothetical protein [Acidobacteriota bacterium]
GRTIVANERQVDGDFAFSMPQPFDDPTLEIKYPGGVLKLRSGFDERLVLAFKRGDFARLHTGLLATIFVQGRGCLKASLWA